MQFQRAQVRAVRRGDQGGEVVSRFDRQLHVRSLPSARVIILSQEAAILDVFDLDVEIQVRLRPDVKRPVKLDLVLDDDRWPFAVDHRFVVNRDLQLNDSVVRRGRDRGVVEVLSNGKRGYGKKREHYEPDSTHPPRFSSGHL